MLQKFLPYRITDLEGILGYCRAYPGLQIFGLCAHSGHGRPDDAVGETSPAGVRGGHFGTVGRCEDYRQAVRGLNDAYRV